jgi:hypothetical protein
MAFEISEADLPRDAISITLRCSATDTPDSLTF